jgi:periplasmic protein TonB
LQRLLAFADREGARFAVTLVLAGLLCLALLARSVGWLTTREPLPHAHAPTTIDMRLVELAPPTVPAPHVPLASVQRAMPAPAAPSPPVAKRTSTNPAPITHAVQPPRSPTQPRQPPQPHEEAHSPIEPATPEQPVTSTRSAPAATASAAASSAAAPSSNIAAAASAAPSGSTEARLLSQPTPVLPDDLREQGYQVTALAHFKVHADGTFEVELVKPTQNPRLNQILLETLHRWRFFPAMENGHPVESDQDVRVHFSVS